MRHHFVCLTAVDGHLVELDGAYNSGPLVVKPLGDEMLLTAAATHVKEKFPRFFRIGTVLLAYLFLVL